MSQCFLEIGAGKRPQGGWINSDLTPGPGINVVFDACQPWPIKDNSIDFIRMNHTLEHLPDPFMCMKEAWRVLKPEPEPRRPNLLVVVPHGVSDASLADLTHVRPYTAGSFACFQLGYNEAVYNPQHNTWDAPFDVSLICEHINPKLRWLMLPIIKRWSVYLLDYLWNGYTEIRVHMRTLKTQRDRDEFSNRKAANTIGVVPFLYRHEYEHRDLHPNEKLAMKFFGPYAKQLQVLFETNQ